MLRDDQALIGHRVGSRVGPWSAGRRIGVATAALCAFGLVAGIPSADAQMIPSGPEPAPAAKGPAAKGARKGAPAASDEAAKKDPAVALRSLEAGIKSYEINKLEPAVQQLTAALANGLPSQQMARALYYRGLAFRKQAKPAQAISDLTSAIWLKGGLAEAERANAIESRAAAYREAGLGEPSPVAGDSARAAAAPAASAASASTWQTATATGGSSAASSAPKVSAAPETPPAAPASSSSAGSSASSSGGVGSFFSGLFGGSSSSSEAAPALTTTASTKAAAAPVTATSSWGEATSVASAKGRAPVADAPSAPAPNVKVAAAAPAAAAPAAPAYKGKFRLQVAAVRSRSEAEALAQKLKQGHGAAIGGREPAIEQSVIGAMGTFYRVRVGPYADANEPRQLCSRIKPDGFDCLVVTQ